MITVSIRRIVGRCCIVYGIKTSSDSSRAQANAYAYEYDLGNDIQRGRCRGW